MVGSYKNKHIVWQCVFKINNAGAALTILVLSKKPGAALGKKNIQN